MLEAIGHSGHVERLCNEDIAARDQLYMVLILKPDARYGTGTNILLTFVLNLNDFFIFLFLSKIQKAVDKLLAFDVSNGDLSLFFQDIFSY